MDLERMASFGCTCVEASGAVPAKMELAKCFSPWNFGCNWKLIGLEFGTDFLELLNLLLHNNGLLEIA